MSRRSVRSTESEKADAMTRVTERMQTKTTTSVEEVDVEALLREAEAADAAARATLRTPEQERSIIAAAEALAGSKAGVPAKSRAAVQRLASKWVDFLERHGTEYGWDESVGPTLELTKHFQTWGFFNRTNYSTVGVDGMGDS